MLMFKNGSVYQFRSRFFVCFDFISFINFPSSKGAVSNVLQNRQCDNLYPVIDCSTNNNMSEYIYTIRYMYIYKSLIFTTKYHTS